MIAEFKGVMFPHIQIGQTPGAGVAGHCQHGVGEAGGKLQHPFRAAATPADVEAADSAGVILAKVQDGFGGGAAAATGIAHAESAGDNVIGPAGQRDCHDAARPAGQAGGIGNIEIRAGIAIRESRQTAHIHREIGAAGERGNDQIGRPYRQGRTIGAGDGDDGRDRGVGENEIGHGLGRALEVERGGGGGGEIDGRRGG